MKQIRYILLLSLSCIFVSAQTGKKSIRISDQLQLVQLNNQVWAHVSVEEIAGFGKVSSNGLVYVVKGKAFLFDSPVTDSLTQVLVKVVADSLKSEIVGFVPNHWHVDCMGGLKYLQSIGI